MFRTTFPTVAKAVTTLSVVALACSSTWAQSPSSMADNSYEYNAYVYSYSAMVFSGGVASTMSGSTVEDDVAQMVDEMTTDGFFLCYEALVLDDDTLWQEATDELSLARFWCNTLIVYAED